MDERVRFVARLLVLRHPVFRQGVPLPGPTAPETRRDGAVGVDCASSDRRAYAKSASEQGVREAARHIAVLGKRPALRSARLAARRLMPIIAAQARSDKRLARTSGRSSGPLCVSSSDSSMIDARAVNPLRRAMHTVEDLLENLQRPACQQAPSWRVRMKFRNGMEWEGTYEPDGCWPEALVAHPPARFIARQSMVLVRYQLREYGMAAVRLLIRPPPGTIDDHGRRVRSLLAIVKL